MNWNGVLIAGLLGWGIAQLIKFCLYFIINRVAKAERLVGSGGMPSSHSSMVCALAVSAGRACGFQSPLFAVAAVFGAIVMYDAMNVRLEAGQHARILNHLLTDAEKKPAQEFQRKKALKELLGHTPLEVVCGALLGIVIGIVTPLGACVG